MKGGTIRSSLTMTLLLTAVVAWPLIPHVPYDLLTTAILACRYLIVALSLVLLIGLVGQISLGQAALVGMGAFVAAVATTRFGIHFPYTLAIGTAAGAITATAIGLVALRVRGLYLAVATLIFAYVCDQYLFAQTWLVQSQSGTSIPLQAMGIKGAFPYFDLADAHVFYYLALAVAAFALYSVANIRDSRVGRAFAAVRGSEVAAASLGIAVTRFKLMGFALAGALAGLGGAVTLIGERSIAPDEFNFIHSLDFLAIAVVGGLRSLGGAIASSVVFALLVGEVFYRYHGLADYLDVISAGLLIAVLLFFRGGLGAVPERVAVIRERLRGRGPASWWRRQRATDADLAAGDVGTPEPGPAPAAADAEPEPVFAHRQQPWWRRVRPAAEGVDLPPPIDVLGLVRRFSHVLERKATILQFKAPAADASPAVRERTAALIRAAREDGQVAGRPAADGRREPLLLRAAGITVQFGGLRAVADTSIQVGAGEIVGLIGPNGAGKTTLFNSVLGLNTPTQGRVELFGRDVTKWNVHRRAALGVGRTFQVIQLFRDLTVFDNLLVATHLQSRVGPLGAIFVTPGARMTELAMQRRVSAVLRLMGLEDIAGQRVAGLPFGVLRLVEVARTLVTGAPLVCFDEPASGLDSAETERLIDWFRFLRQIGVTLLVIEHDVSMVVRLCDHIYVLDQGKLIASGTPAQIQRDPQVVASYLGTAVQAAS